jgi:hypothetical protein
MTYYDDNPYGPKRHTPLIHLIPDHHDDLDASDEEDDFYGKDEDFLIPKRYHQRIERLPRRVKRISGGGIALAFLFLISWWTYFGPRYSAYKHEISLMDHAPEMLYGSNARHTFKDMIQVSDMDEQHLPKKGQRLVFVGDVHGCRKELEHLLKKVDFRRKHDHLVLAGDMINKGPDSPGVVKLMQDLGASCVRGNWEDKLLLTVAEAERHHDLTSVDDNAPLDFLDAHHTANPKLLKLAKQFSRRQLLTLQQCPVILRIGAVPNLGNLVVVHAGLVPDIPLESQDPFHVMNMRTIDLETRIPSSKHEGGTPWEKFWNHRQMKLKEKERTTVVYGHNRKKGLNLHEYSKGLDTGCASGGKLTALVVDHEGKMEVVHVKCDKEGGYDD